MRHGARTFDPDGTMAITVTLDTNISPPESVTGSVPDGTFDFAVVSVTERETAGTRYQVKLGGLRRVVETAVYGESRWGDAVWGSENDTDCLETVLQVISHGAFPRPGDRDSLTHGQLRQLRDAMIFCAHVRTGRQVFVTNDRNGFIDEGRRSELERKFGTSIMTATEFIANYQGGTP